MASSNKIQYIQGLRALCVLLVLFFHIDKTWLPSGYLGVDAFFAISGYVITRLIVKEWQQGQFRLKHFYFTRIRKLLPPLFVVVIVSVIAFHFLFGSSDRLAVYLSSIFTVASLSNFYFYMDAGYFSEANIYKPLLHTWSLGVEEQFYLLWPLLLLFFLNKAWVTPKIIFTASLLLAVASASMVLVDFDLAFYLMPFRAYQLLFGAAFAILALKLRSTEHQIDKAAEPPSRHLLYVVLLCLIPPVVITLSWFEYVTQIKQFYAQLIVSFTIAGGCFVAERLLSISSTQIGRTPLLLRVMQSSIASYFGARSYLIYLVHWPIIVGLYSHFGKAFDEDWRLKIIAMIACLLSAEALHRLLNPATASFRPFASGGSTDPGTPRRNPISHNLKVIAAVGLAAAVIPAILLATQVSDTSASRAQPWALSDFFPKLKGESSTDSKSQYRCHFGVEQNFPFEPDVLIPCLSSISKNVLVVGDSFSRDAYRALKLRHPGINFINVYLGGCPPYFGVDQNDIEKQKVMPKCNRFREPVWRHVYDHVLQYDFANDQFDAVVVAGNWKARSLDLAILKNSFAQLNALPLDVYIMGVRPVYVDSIVRMHETAKINPQQEILNDHLHAQPDVFNTVLTELVAGFDNIDYIDIFNSLCSPDCNAYYENELVYSDHAHLTDAGARLVAKNRDFARQLQ